MYDVALQVDYITSNLNYIAHTYCREKENLSQLVVDTNCKNTKKMMAQLMFFLTKPHWSLVKKVLII